MCRYLLVKNIFSNIAVIISGGSGTRKNTKIRPNQFFELNGKPILILLQKISRDMLIL